MSVNYKSYEFRVYEHISQLDKMLHEGDSSDELKQWQSEVERLRHEFESKHFRVAIVGEFNRGKTTFVNALLGKEILPSDYLPTTAAINRITYSDTPNAYIVLKSGAKQAIRITELAEYITKLSKAATEKAAQIHEAVVEYPSLFCRNGVDLIDTPGMNDEDDMNQVTISRLEGIDLAIVAVDASMPFSMTECAFTVRLLESPQICQIIIVVTKIDMIRERERQKLVDFMVARVREDVKARLSQTHAEDSEVMQKYHAIFDKPYVFAVSATEALDALSCNNMELFEKCGMLRLNNSLPQIIMSSQNSNVILSAEREIQNLIGKYRKWLQRQRPTAQQLNEMKTSFAQTSYEVIAKAYNLSEAETSSLLSLLPEDDREFIAIRKNFIQALGEMKMLSYAELKRVFLPVTKGLYQVVNEKYHASEKLWLKNYRENIMEPLERELCRKLDILLQPFPVMYQTIKPELNALSHYFALEESEEEVQNFYWVRSPIPDGGVLGVDWNVMAYVDPVIREALADYRNRQRKQMIQFFKQSKQRLDDQIQKLVREVFARTASYIEQLNHCMEKEKVLLGRLEELERDSQELKKKFLAEAG